MYQHRLITFHPISNGKYVVVLIVVDVIVKIVIFDQEVLVMIYIYIYIHTGDFHLAFKQTTNYYNNLWYLVGLLDLQ